MKRLSDEKRQKLWEIIQSRTAAGESQTSVRKSLKMSNSHYYNLKKKFANSAPQIVTHHVEAKRGPKKGWKRLDKAGSKIGPDSKCVVIVTTARDLRSIMEGVF